MAPEPIRSDVNAMVLANFNSPTFTASTSTYKIFGMTVPITTISMAIENAFDYTSELMGDSAMIEVTNFRKIKLFCADYATLRVLDVLNGVAIHTHYNYSSGGFNVQKPVIGQMAAMIEEYRQKVKRGQKLILTRGKVDTGPVNMDVSIINERAPQGSGVEIVTYDAPNL